MFCRGQVKAKTSVQLRMYDVLKAVHSPSNRPDGMEKDYRCPDVLAAYSDIFTGTHKQTEESNIYANTCFSVNDFLINKLVKISFHFGIHLEL